MITTVGKVLKKERRLSQNKIDIVVQDGFGNTFSFEVRPRYFSKTVVIDTGQLVKVSYKTELGEKFCNETKETRRINNLILKDIVIL